MRFGSLEEYFQDLLGLGEGDIDLHQVPIDLETICIFFAS